MHLLPKYANITELTITAKSKSMRIAIILYYLFVKYFNICSLDIFTLFLKVFFLQNNYILYSTNFITLVKYFNIYISRMNL